ncbi:unnamed protein product [Caenorhabditis brenneri]
MRTFQRYTSILIVLSLIIVVFIEEFNVGKGYIFIANRYNGEVIRNITVSRADKKENIGIVIVLNNVKDEDNYQMALDTVRCYGRNFQYDVHVIYANEEKSIMEKCQQKDFMFRRHCVLSLKMSSIPNTWLLFLDGDMGIINPNHLIEDYIPENPKIQIVFYNRIMNQEVMAGSYLVQNSDWSRKFLMFWANFEDKLPNSFHGSDNGAVHAVILYQAAPEISSKREFCVENYWETSRDYESLSTFEVCAQELIRNNSIPEIKILPKGRLAWARDGWLTNSVWSETDFIFHGWQKKRKDKLIFAMWHSPLIYDKPWNLTKCSEGEASQNWRYKDTFIGNVIDVDRKLFATIQDEEKSYKKHLDLVAKNIPL